MANPDIACTYLSKFFNGSKFIPKVVIKTDAIIVIIVTALKTDATKTMPTMLCLAAGYISIGISGSHGPRTKTTNKAQGT
ncbi:MAG: hypothetical protein A2267_05745 [Omnitrophica WOR_2 bacterium RIFOXYA12_FULL_38_10]|nr:MAG: hypothetical protein A2267_05745 [Omnitrophica WOR_2 bacterium RIFOXYA12_FULL_38_10]